MGFSLAIRMLPEVQKSLAAGSIAAGYTGVGTAFSNPVRILFLQNLTDAAVQWSMDGIDDHFPMPANGFLLLDVMGNKSVSDQFFISEGTRMYVKQLGVPTTGSVYVSAMYGKK